MIVPTKSGQCAPALMSACPLPVPDRTQTLDMGGGGALAEALLRHAADVFLVLDDNGAIRYASASAGRALGVPPERLRGVAPVDLVHADDAASLRAFLDALDGPPGEMPTAEVRLQHSAGDWRRFALTGIDLRAEPTVRGFVISLRDVTALRHSERRSAAFLKLGQQLGAATTAEEAARIIARVADELLGWDAYYLSLYSVQDDLVTPVLGFDEIGGQRTEVSGVSEIAEPPGALWRSVIDNGGQLLLRHNSQEAIATLDPFGDVERPSAALIFVPVRADAVVVGILSIQSYTENAYTPDDMALLQALADHCGGALERVRAEAALRASEVRLRHQATHDALTGLPNRALFSERLARALSILAVPNGVVAVLFLDLDRFKVVNDSLGHEAGDALLVLVAAQLRAALRPADMAARLGGDEFTVLLEGIAGAEDAARVAGRIADLFAQPFAIGRHQIVVSVSIGIAVGETGRDRPAELLRRADIALYSAKNGGRSRYVVFDTAMSDAAVERLELESELRRAIESGALQLHYQPLVDLATGCVERVEALIRWPRGAHGVMRPDRFIPLAEETGLILALGRWSLREACRQAHEWRTHGPYPELKIGVNLSAMEFAQPGVVASIEEILRETGLDATALELEITEGVIMADVATTSVTVRGLKRLGVRLAIDDFGTGYSSLGYLKRFPVDTLKIDKTFVDGLGRDPDDEAIVRAMIGIAQALGLQVVAEGIETAVQAVRLLELGCALGQGYFFAPPGPPTTIAPLLASSVRCKER